MSPRVKLLTVLLALLLQLLVGAWWWLQPRFGHGPVLDESFRNQERLAALSQWNADRTPRSRTTYDSELALLNAYLHRRRQAIFALALLLNAAGIVGFWRYTPQRESGVG